MRLVAASPFFEFVASAQTQRVKDGADGRDIFRISLVAYDAADSRGRVSTRHIQQALDKIGSKNRVVVHQQNPVRSSTLREHVAKSQIDCAAPPKGAVTAQDRDIALLGKKFVGAIRRSVVDDDQLYRFVR